MANHPRRVVDRTASLLIKGYAWLPDLMRRSDGPVVRTRVLGRHAVALRGPAAVAFFYDERHVRRHAAVPEPVRATLFGRGGIHSLDGDEHRSRKAMFLPLLKDSAQVADLTTEVAAAWDAVIPSWTGQPRVVLFDETAEVLTRGVCRWAGVPLASADASGVARDLVAMVDGFATAGARHWRARRARSRREAWLTDLVSGVRSGSVEAPARSALHVASWHLDADGQLLEPGLAAVELLNVLRPTVAVSWFVAFAAHALHRRPENRERLAAEDAEYSAAFAHEVRRFYPFAPFTAGRAVADLRWQDEHIPEGSLVLLDLYGQNHDAELWRDPYTFRPERFVSRPPRRDELIPQGGGDPAEGHRCPGEDVTLSLLQALTTRLARLDYEVPDQRLGISLRRVPTRPPDGFVIADVRMPARPMA